MPEQNINFTIAFLYLVIPAAIGALFGFLTNQYSEWRRENRLKKRMTILLYLEIKENIELCTEAIYEEEYDEFEDEEEIESEKAATLPLNFYLYI